MARLASKRELGVWANGRRVGIWRLPSRGDMEFLYDSQWIASSEARPLSLSMPIVLDRAPLKGAPVAAYFDNLLPDSDTIRRRLQERFRTDSTRAFDLLYAIGRDCVGAVQLLPPDEAPARIETIEAQPLTDLKVERAIAHSLSASAFDEDRDEFRISIAGAQEKTAFLRHRNRWCRPLGATPTTHIFKLPLGLIGNRRADMTTSVENEWLCSRILSAYGLPVAPCEIGRFGHSKVLIVERFDRQLHSSGQYWLRLLQEDFCQATGTPPERKYEADGGPGLKDIGRILQGSLEREADLTTVFKAQLLFWMLAATDGHAKNFSIRLLAGGRYRLTPLYDVLSAWPIVGDGGSQIPIKRVKLAMALHSKNTHYRVRDIQRRHFESLATQLRLARDSRSLIDETIEATPRVIADIQEQVPRAFPQRIVDSILQGLGRSARQLAA